MFINVMCSKAIKRVTFMLLIAMLLTTFSAAIGNGEGNNAFSITKLEFDSPYTVQSDVTSNFLVYVYEKNVLVTDTTYRVTMSIDETVTPAVCSSANLPSTTNVEGLGIALFQNVSLKLLTDEQVVTCPIVFSVLAPEADKPYKLVQPVTIQAQNFDMRLVSPLRLVNGDSATYTVSVFQSGVILDDLSEEKFLSIATQAPCALETNSEFVPLKSNGTAEFPNTLLKYGFAVKSCKLIFTLYDHKHSAQSIITEKLNVSTFQMDLLQPLNFSNNQAIDYIVQVKRNDILVNDASYTVRMSIDESSAANCTLNDGFVTAFVLNGLSVFKNVAIVISVSDAAVTNCVLQFQLQHITPEALFIQTKSVDIYMNGTPVIEWTSPTQIMLLEPSFLNVNIINGEPPAFVNFTVDTNLSPECIQYDKLIPFQVTGKTVALTNQVFYPDTVDYCVFEFSMYDAQNTLTGTKQHLLAATTHLTLKWLGPFDVLNNVPVTYKFLVIQSVGKALGRNSLRAHIELDPTSVATCVFTRTPDDAITGELQENSVQLPDVTLRTTSNETYCTLLITIFRTPDATTKTKIPVHTSKQQILVTNAIAPITLITSTSYSAMNSAPFDVVVSARRGDVVFGDADFGAMLSIAPKDANTCAFVQQPQRTPLGIGDDAGSVTFKGVAVHFGDGATMCPVSVTLVHAESDDVQAATIFYVYQIGLSMTRTSSDAIVSGASADIEMRVWENGKDLERTGFTASLTSGAATESMCSLAKPYENVEVGTGGAVTFASVSVTSTLPVTSGELLCGLSWSLSWNAVEVAKGTVYVPLQISAHEKKPEPAAPTHKHDHGHAVLYVMLTLIVLIVVCGGVYFWRRRGRNTYSKDLYVNH